MATTPTKMPADVAETHGLIGRELSYLYTKWNYFKRLYCTDDETVRTLNGTAEFFFMIYREVLRDDMILTVCRLTDPASTRVSGVAKPNISIKRLKERIPVSDSSLHKSLEKPVALLDSQVTGFREHRNRRIGHSDLDTRRRRPHASVPSLGLSDMEKSLRRIARVLNIVDRYYDKNEKPYYDGIHGSGDAEQLIEFIRRNKSLEQYYSEREFGDSGTEDDSE